jgi:dolichyl-phosphate-mannose-protein mannosyltransferase
VQTYDEICGFLVIGWALHYLPFYLMDRQLFLHHYFPALWFAILCFCAVFDLVTRRVKRTRRIQAAGAIVIFALLAYGKFSPLTYGNKWTKAQCEKAKWLRTWDFSWCGRVPIPIRLLLVTHPTNPVAPTSTTATAITMLLTKRHSLRKRSHHHPSRPPLLHRQSIWPRNQKKK